MKKLLNIQTSLQIARDMQKKALCFYSKFAVGAAIQTQDNHIIGGFNIESASYGLTICAERVAVFSAMAQGYKDFTHITLVTDTASFPCGACRQILYEFCPKAQITIATQEQVLHTLSIIDLMPHAFKKEDIELQ